MKTVITSLTFALVATASYANTLVQTDSSYIAFDAISHTSATNWTAIADTTITSTAGGTALSNGSVMVYADTDGIDSSSVNNIGTENSDLITYTIDFTAADTYSLYVRAGTGFISSGSNDSIFVPTSGTITGGESANFTRNNLNQGVSPSPYAWYEVGAYTIGSTEATSGTSISFSIAGREGDFQLDRLVFHGDSGLASGTLDALSVTAVPEPSSYGLITALACIGFIATRRKRL